MKIAVGKIYPYLPIFVEKASQGLNLSLGVWPQAFPIFKSWLIRKRSHPIPTQKENNFSKIPCRLISLVKWPVGIEHKFVQIYKIE